MKFAVVAHRHSATNDALVAAARAWGLESELVDPHRALSRLEPGDVALARLDVRKELDGIESGTGELERLAAGGVDVRNPTGSPRRRPRQAADRAHAPARRPAAPAHHAHQSRRCPRPSPSSRSCSSRGSAVGGATSSGARRPRSSTRRSSGCSGSRGSASTARSRRSSSSRAALGWKHRQHSRRCPAGRPLRPGTAAAGTCVSSWPAGASSGRRAGSPETVSGGRTSRSGRRSRRSSRRRSPEHWHSARRGRPEQTSLGSTSCRPGTASSSSS